MPKGATFHTTADHIRYGTCGFHPRCIGYFPMRGWDTASPLRFLSDESYELMLAVGEHY